MLIGSRTNLRYISNNFHDVWITFIRELNRFSTKNQNKDQLLPKIVLLHEKISILGGEVIKKRDYLPKNPSYSDLRRDCMALAVALEKLQHLNEDFRNAVSQTNIII